MSAKFVDMLQELHDLMLKEEARAVSAHQRALEQSRLTELSHILTKMMHDKEKHEQSR